MSEQQVLAALAEALGPAAVSSRGPNAAARLSVLRTMQRNRSSLYFVAPAGEDAPRWVVKRPETRRAQADLRPPPDAAAQYAALEVLHEHLSSTSSRVAAPAPVALLADVGAFASEYVAGHTLLELLGAGTVGRPSRLLDGIRDAAGALALIHQIAPEATESADETPSLACALEQAEQQLRAAGLDHRVRRPLLSDTVRGHGLDGRRDPRGDVLLHGDWAPENVLLAGPRLICLDPELTQRGRPEHDVARFLVMLCDAPLFVTAMRIPAVARLRRRAAVTFAHGYYGSAGVSPGLQPLMVASLASRWVMRDADVVRRKPRAASWRRALLRRHFTALLDEVAEPGWPECRTTHAARSLAHRARPARP